MHLLVDLGDVDLSAQGAGYLRAKRAEPAEADDADLRTLPNTALDGHGVVRRQPSIGRGRRLVPGDPVGQGQPQSLVHRHLRLEPSVRRCTRALDGRRNHHLVADREPSCLWADCLDDTGDLVAERDRPIRQQMCQGPVEEPDIAMTDARCFDRHDNFALLRPRFGNFVQGERLTYLFKLPRTHWTSRRQRIRAASATPIPGISLADAGGGSHQPAPKVNDRVASARRFLHRREPPCRALCRGTVRPRCVPVEAAASTSDVPLTAMTRTARLSTMLSKCRSGGARDARRASRLPLKMRRAPAPQDLRDLMIGTADRCGQVS